jgi:cytochrome c biogenesis protein CcdA
MFGLILAVIILLSSSALANTQVDFTQTDSVLVCFVTTACAECEKVEAFLDSLPSEAALQSGESSRIVLIELNVTQDENVESVRKYFEAYSVPDSDQHVPIMFFSKGYLSGADAIIAGTMESIESGKALGFSYPSETGSGSTMEFPAIFLAGLLGGVNPCSVSMLLLLLSLLSSKAKNVAKIGFSYLAGKFIAYLAIGLSLFSAAGLLESEGFAAVKQFVRIAVILAAAGLAIFNIFDFFSARKEEYGKIKVQLPKRLRRFNNKLIESFAGGNARFTIPAIFLLGLVVSAGEFLCTGQIYLAAILYQIRINASDAPRAYLSLFIYCAASMIPAGALIAFCSKGKSALELSDAARRNLPLIKLLNAALFAIIAVAALLFF